MPKAGKINFVTLFFAWILNRKKLPPKPRRSCQKLEKTIFEYFFHSSLNKKSCHQNQDRAESWKHQFWNTFLNWILNKNKLPPKPRSCQKLDKFNFWLFFKFNFEQKQSATKTKIVPRAGKIKFWILLYLKHIQIKTFWDLCFFPLVYLDL